MLVKASPGDTAVLFVIVSVSWHNLFAGAARPAVIATYVAGGLFGGLIAGALRPVSYWPLGAMASRTQIGSLGPNTGNLTYPDGTPIPAAAEAYANNGVVGLFTAATNQGFFHLFQVTAHEFAHGILGLSDNGLPGPEQSGDGRSECVLGSGLSSIASVAVGHGEASFIVDSSPQALVDCISRLVARSFRGNRPIGCADTEHPVGDRLAGLYSKRFKLSRI
jgi:hypothetical protein